MPFINCEINLMLTSSCDNTNSTGAKKFATRETNLYVPVVTLSTQDKAKLLQQLKLVLKEKSIRININDNINRKTKSIITLFN